MSWDGAKESLVTLDLGLRCLLVAAPLPVQPRTKIWH